MSTCGGCGCEVGHGGYYCNCEKESIPVECVHVCCENVIAHRGHDTDIAEVYHAMEQLGDPIECEDCEGEK